MNLSVKKSVSLVILIASLVPFQSLLGNIDYDLQRIAHGATSVPTGSVYSFDFNTLPVGKIKESAFLTALSTRYMKEATRVAITNSPANSYSGNALQVLYPKGKTGTSFSGVTFESDIKASLEDSYMSYWVKFNNGFDFRSGGKLPGIGGSDSFPYGANDFSTRLMWREDGKLEFYLHGYQVKNKYGKEPYRVWWNYATEPNVTYWDTGSVNNSASLVAGKWHHIEMHVKMNTPGKKDGLLEAWLDGTLVCKNTDDANMRGVNKTKTKINYLFFSTFFGGSSDPMFQAIKDEYTYFDDLKISTVRLGYPGPKK